LGTIYSVDYYIFYYFAFALAGATNEDERVTTPITAL